MRKKQKPLMECRTENDICAQPRDNIAAGGFWICSDSHTVNLFQQRSGEESKQEFEIPKGTFDRLIRWYTTGRMNKSPRKVSP